MNDGRSVRRLSGSEGVFGSYFLPGGFGKIHFDTTLPHITMHNFTDAGTFIQADAPGYQVDFAPVDDSVDPHLELKPDCRVLGLPQVALLVCLKEANSSLIAGTLHH